MMKTVKHLFLWAVLAGGILAPFSASAQDAENGQKDDSQAVIDERNRLEETVNGDDLVLAMNAAGRLTAHYRAQGDEAKADEWQKKFFELLRKRAESGETTAMNMLGQLYAKGSDSFDADPVEARRWYEKAAEAGDAHAQYTVATLYMRGVGGPVDLEKASGWFARALDMLKVRAENGDANAAFWTGQIYFRGLGTKTDEAQAFKYFLISAEKGDIRSQAIVAFMYREGKGCEANEACAVDWFRKLAEKNDVGAIMEVALAYQEGKGVEKDAAEARKWLQKGAELNDFYSLRALGMMHEQGEGGEKDEAKALECYEKAAYAGDVYSLIEAVRLLKESDPDKALELLRLGANQYKSPVALYELALFEKQRGDNQLFVKLTQEAAENGYTPAMLEAGSLHLTPFSGAKWNPRISYYWWDQAEKHGDAHASSYKSWLLWGGLGGIVVLVILIILLLNPLIKRRIKAQEEMARVQGEE